MSRDDRRTPSLTSANAVLVLGTRLHVPTPRIRQHHERAPIGVRVDGRTVGGHGVRVAVARRLSRRRRGERLAAVPGRRPAAVRRATAVRRRGRRGQRRR